MPLHRAGLISLLVLCAACGPTERSQVLASRDRIDFGTVEAAVTSFRVNVVLTNPGATTVRLKRLVLEPAAPELTLDGLPLESLAGGARDTITVVYTPRAEGTVESELLLEADDGLGLRRIPVKGRAVRLGALVRPDQLGACPGQPDALDFGTVTSGTPVTRQVTIESTGTGAITVLQALANPADAGFVVAGNFGKPLAPGDSAAFTVRLDPRLPGAQAGAVSFITNSLAVTRLEVPTCATGLVPLLCAAPSELDLGPVDAGASARGTITATSCGNLPVTLRDVALMPDAGAGFTARPASALPRVLNPAEQLDVTVDFTASSSVVARRELRLQSSSAVTPEVLVPVAANEPPPCRVTVKPTSLQFYKAVSTSQSVQLTNLGNDDCLVERVEVVTPGAPFGLARPLTFPVVLGARSTLDFEVKYTPLPSATSSTTATLELELDKVHRVTLKGDPRPPGTCRLVPSATFIDFGLIDARLVARQSVALTNVSGDTCTIYGILSDRTEIVASSAAMDIDPLTSAQLSVQYVPPTQGAAPIIATVTVLSNDLTQPRLQLPVIAGHVRCDPDCTCAPNQTLTYWRFHRYVGSSIHQAAPGESAFERSCDPARCPANQVALEVDLGSLQCVAQPPSCGPGEGLDYRNEGWLCVPCPVIVQYGGLFNGLRVCASLPNLSCASGQSPTFDERAHDWRCVTTCTNTTYDQVRLPDGSIVCVPC